MMSARRTYTNEYKRQAVELVTREGLSVAEAARRLGIGQPLLAGWRKRFDSLGEGAFPANGSAKSALEEENQRLRAENARLLMERDILKKATAFFAKESK